MYRWTIRDGDTVVKAGDADRAWEAWDNACIALMNSIGCSWSDLGDDELEVVDQIHHSPVSVEVRDFVITTAATS